MNAHNATAHILQFNDPSDTNVYLYVDNMYTYECMYEYLCFL